MLKQLSLAAALGLTLVAVPAFAGDDSSADAGDGFVSHVESSEGVMIKVPINERGEELTDRAEMRVTDASVGTSTSADFATAWNRGVDASSQPQIDPNADTSTDHRGGGSARPDYGWSQWGQCGGYQYNYYYSYQPTYYYYQYTYRYNTPVYYNYYHVDPTCYGYRYYYYRRCR